MKKGILALGVCIITVFMGITGYSFGSNASVGAEIISEDTLLSKDKIVEEICIFEDGVNPYFASTKTVVISNLPLERLEKIRSKGWTIIITGREPEGDLPVPVTVDKKTIKVSVHSTNEALIDILNRI